LARIRQRKTAGQPPEQRQAKLLFKTRNLLADRRRRHAEFARGCGKSAGAGGSLEGAQSIEGRQRGYHET
jgi:hypothetical protein